ncbi:MAG: preprotein translocase subunit SecG, partial [Proteobacteria bacterium]|nr:preprotein translocase subunit SecG [Pseudomonadota bacterium]
MTLIYIIFTIVCIFLVITVLLQPGKSGGLGAAFGGGGNTVFGASGGTPVFRRMTTGAAVCFMLLSLLIAYLSLDTTVTGDEGVKKRGLDFSDIPAESQEIPAGLAVPEIPAPAPAPAAEIPAPAPAPAAEAPAAAPAAEAPAAAPAVEAPAAAPAVEAPA